MATPPSINQNKYCVKYCFAITFEFCKFWRSSLTGLPVTTIIFFWGFVSAPYFKNILSPKLQP